MTNSKLVNKKVLIPAAIVAVAVGLTIWGLSPGNSRSKTNNEQFNARLYTAANDSEEFYQG